MRRSAVVRLTESAIGCRIEGEQPRLQGVDLSRREKVPRARTPMSEANELAPRADTAAAGRSAPSARVAAAAAHRAQHGAVAIDWAHLLRWLQRITRTSCRSADDWDEVSQEAAVRAWQALSGGGHRSAPWRACS